MTLPTPNPRTFRARQILCVTLGALLLGIAAGFALSLVAGWAEGRDLRTDALSAGLVWFVASLLGLQVLLMGSGHSMDRLGLGVMAASIARMLTAIMLGFVVFFLLKPSGLTFWVCFLGAGLFILIAESVWAIRTVNHAPSK